MAISREEVLRVARLARIALSSSEADRMQAQLGSILTYIRQLDGLDTSDVAPTAHAVETGTPLREDRAHPFGEKEEILKNAPDREGDFFRVPRIIEDERDPQ